MATLYEKLNIVNPPAPTAYWNVSTNLKYHAQPFIAASSHKVDYVKLALARYGDDSTPATITVEIQSNSGSAPSGTVLCTGTTVRETLGIRPDFEWRQIDLGSGTTLVSGTTYWIVLKCDGDFVSPNEWVCQYGFNDVTGDPWYFTDGKLNLSVNGGSTWTAQGVDPAKKGAMFEVYSSSKVKHYITHGGHRGWGF